MPSSSAALMEVFPMFWKSGPSWFKGHVQLLIPYHPLSHSIPGREGLQTLAKKLKDLHPFIHQRPLSAAEKWEELRGGNAVQRWAAFLYSRVSSGGNKVEAAVHSGVGDALLSGDVDLLFQELLILLIDVLGDGLPAAVRVSVQLHALKPRCMWPRQEDAFNTIGEQ